VEIRETSIYRIPNNSVDRPGLSAIFVDGRRVP
jgi:hypothetical protein